jgi:hypothetical protein
MRSPGVDYKAIKRKCKVYDADKKKLIGEFESLSAAGEFLGISAGLVKSSIKHKSINKTNKLGLRIAIR